MNIFEAGLLIKRVQADPAVPPHVRAAAIIQEGAHVPRCTGSTGFCPACYRRDRAIIAAGSCIDAYYRELDGVPLVA